MKRFIVGAVFILCFCLVGAAQTEEEEEDTLVSCPSIQVQVPEGALPAGETLSFAVLIDGEVQKREYEWTVSAGEMISGSDNAEIQVATNAAMSGQITATVTVKGLPENCGSQAAGIAVITQRPPVIHPDEYGKIPLKDEFAKFGNLFLTYLRDPGTKAYIRFGIGMDEKVPDVRERLTSIFNFLDENRYDRNLMIFDVCRSEARHTVFWVIPDGAEYPSSDDCDKVYIDFSEQ